MLPLPGIETWLLAVTQREGGAQMFELCARTGKQKEYSSVLKRFSEKQTPRFHAVCLFRYRNVCGCFEPGAGGRGPLLVLLVRASPPPLV